MCVSVSGMIEQMAQLPAEHIEEGTPCMEDSGPKFVVKNRLNEVKQDDSLV